MCMIQLWRGQEPTEAAFHDGVNPLPLEVVGRLGDVKLQHFDPGQERHLRIELHRGKRIVAFVLGSPYVAITSSKYADLTSRHGPMCDAGNFNGPMHAIVLLSCAATSFQYLDPYLAGDSQPLELTDDELERCFAGVAAVFSRPSKVGA